MDAITAERLAYPQALQIIGGLIESKELADVCVLEFEKGFIVTGSLLYETAESYKRQTETVVLSHEELARMAKGATDAKANAG